MNKKYFSIEYFHNKSTIEYKFDVHHNCNAKRFLSFYLKLFTNQLSRFRTKLKIRTFTIENV